MVKFLIRVVFSALLVAAGSLTVSADHSPYPRKIIDVKTGEAPGTILIDSKRMWLYYILGKGKAIRYGVAIGRDGYGWTGTSRITRKAKWPHWRPPAEMRKRHPDLPKFVPGGPKNPMGARALYLGSSLYRIHGTNAIWTIRRAVSSGCFRLHNDDVIDLYKRSRVGTKVIVY